MIPSPRRKHRATGKPRGRPPVIRTYLESLNARERAEIERLREQARTIRRGGRALSDRKMKEKNADWEFQRETHGVVEVPVRNVGGDYFPPVEGDGACDCGGRIVLVGRGRYCEHCGRGYFTGDVVA